MNSITLIFVFFSQMIRLLNLRMYQSLKPSIIHFHHPPSYSPSHLPSLSSSYLFSLDHTKTKKCFVSSSAKMQEKESNNNQREKKEEPNKQKLNKFIPFAILLGGCYIPVNEQFSSCKSNGVKSFAVFVKKSSLSLLSVIVFGPFVALLMFVDDVIHDWNRML